MGLKHLRVLPRSVVVRSARWSDMWATFSRLSPPIPWLKVFTFGRGRHRIKYGINTKRASWASIHISILNSFLHCWSQRKIYAAGARHNFCDWRIPLFFSLFLRSSILGVFWGRRREKSDDAEKHSCHRQSSKGPKPRKPVWALCKCICEYGWWFVKWLAHAVSLISFLTRVITFISSKNLPDSW